MTENIPTVCGRCRHRSEIWDWRKLLFKTLKFCWRKLISWEIWQTTNYPVFKVIIWYWKSPGGVSIEQLTLLINWFKYNFLYFLAILVPLLVTFLHSTITSTMPKMSHFLIFAVTNGFKDPAPSLPQTLLTLCMVIWVGELHSVKHQNWIIQQNSNSDLMSQKLQQTEQLCLL